MPDTIVFLRRSLFPAEVLQQYTQWLTHEERQTLNDELSVAQTTRLLSRWALRLTIEQYVPEHAQSLVIDTTSKGKPFFKDSGIMFNISHSGEWLVIAITHNEEIGIDYESVKNNSKHLKIAARFFATSENQELTAAQPEQQPLLFNQMWSAKEAILKSVGLGIAHMLNKVVISPAAHTFYFNHNNTNHYTLSGLRWEQGWLHVFSHKPLEHFNLIELAPTLEIHPVTSTISIAYNRSTHL